MSDKPRLRYRANASHFSVFRKDEDGIPCVLVVPVASADAAWHVIWRWWKTGTPIDAARWFSW